MKLNSFRRRAELLARLRPGRTHSRLELAAATGLSVATVSRITRDLVHRKVLIEVEGRKAALGRPTQGLELNGESGRVLGISLLYPELKWVVQNLRGDILRQGSAPLAWKRGPAGVLGPLQKLVRSLARGPDRLAAVGLALPGQWDAARGVSIQYPRIPSWHEVPLRDRLEAWGGVPASLIGYAPALALAEQARRRPAEPRNLITIEVAENIAMGAIVNGAVLEGASGNAGELGHIPVDPQGPPCYCGGRGCLETQATCSSVTAELRDRSYEAAARRAREGDATRRRVLRRAGRRLGTGLATALNLFNPEVLVLNGRFFDAGALVTDSVRQAIEDHAVPSTLQRLAIEQSTLGPLAAPLGAGLVAIRDAVCRM
ncbi:MAG TPA: ROK family transcriptional regulator [Planctomycetota bacterium]|nr:ROK family transcriptional regulator [Planctomycetota bacterium]